MTLEERIERLRDPIHRRYPSYETLREALAIIDEQSKQLEDLAWEYESIIENIGRKDEKDEPNP